MNLMTVCPDWGWRFSGLNYDFDMFDIYLHWLRHWFNSHFCIVPECKFHHKIWQTQSVIRIPIILKFHNRQSLVIISSTTENSHSPFMDKLYILFMYFGTVELKLMDDFATYRTLFEFRMPLENWLRIHHIFHSLVNLYGARVAIIWKTRGHFISFACLNLKNVNGACVSFSVDLLILCTNAQGTILFNCSTVQPNFPRKCAILHISSDRLEYNEACV